MKEILISTYPFGKAGEKPVDILDATGWNIRYNSLGRRLKGDEVLEMIGDANGVIAGTEPYTREVIKNAINLEVISRVGVGLDSVDFQACQDYGVKLTFTPEAPACGVADLAVAQIINLLRGIIISDKSVRSGIWNRYMGSLVAEKRIGIMGLGRIGKRVLQRLKSFDTGEIYAHDIDEKEGFDGVNGVKWLSKKELFEMCDLVTIHIPMNKRNYHCVGMKEMASMKEGSFIVNTSRGPIINEDDLVAMLHNKHLGGAALDVFEKEPYSGPLIQFDNVILTAHIGASATRSRWLMELGAAEDCVRVLKGEKPKNEVTYEDVK